MNILVLHPGSMGVTVATALKNNGHNVFWCSDGRSESTASRASSINLIDLGSLSEAVKQVDVIVSICMGGGVLDIASRVVLAQFEGIFVDLNYVGEQKEISDLASMLRNGGIRYVEGAIYGWPLSSSANQHGERTMYLGGPNSSPSDTSIVAHLTRGDVFDIQIMDESSKLFKQARTEKESASSIPHVDWGMGVVEFPDIAQNIEDSFVDEWIQRRRSVEPNDYTIDHDGMYVSRGGYRFTERQIIEAPERFMNLAPKEGPSEDKQFREYLDQVMLWCIQGYTGIYPESKDAVWWGADGHIAAYKPGSSMGYHHDTAIGQATNNENPGFMTVSGSLIISDRCSGGNLMFKRLNKSFAPVKGSAIFYPANYMGTHAVSEITDGLRISYLEFFGYGTKNGHARRV